MNEVKRMYIHERSVLRDALLNSKAIYEDEILGEDTIEKIQPNYGNGEVIIQLHQQLQNAISGIGIERLYMHQERAIAAGVEKDTNIVLQAPTASGKSIAFLAPVLNTLLKQSLSHGLFIYPMKSLSYDQRIQVEQLNKQLGNRCDSWWYDGDTPREERKAILQMPPKILFTNPEMLNLSFLGNWEKWHQNRFFQRLRWIVIDEMHEYRGYFGSNVSLLFRRFVHKLRELGSQPRFILCSATCANARTHAEQLTGLQYTEINASDNFRPTRDFFFFKPNIRSDKNYWESYLKRIVLAALSCARLNKQLIVFCQSRKFVEECIQLARWFCSNDNKDDLPIIDPELMAVYHAGLHVEERQRILDHLREGTIRIVFSTNALELGIDIGGLDGVILAGFPDTIMAAWQRIGRAGRDWNHKAFVLYFALDRPLDVFYVNNLHAFLNKPLDELVVNPDNEALAKRHVRALRQECDQINNDDLILGKTLGQLVESVAPVYATGYFPHNSIPLRGIIGGKYTLKVGNREVGEISVERQFREAYIGAIFLHGGRTYEVEDVLHGQARVVELKNSEPHFRTLPYLYTYLNVRGFYDGFAWNEFEICYGNAMTNEVLHSVRKKNTLTDEILREWEPNIEGKKQQTDTVWLRLRDPLKNFSEGLESLQHMLRVGIQFVIPTDLHDTFPYTNTKELSAHIVESYPGGIGVAEVVFRKWQQVLSKGVEIAKNCRCRTGCPRCILPYGAYDPFDKRKGIALSKILLGIGKYLPVQKLKNSLWIRYEP